MVSGRRSPVGEVAQVLVSGLGGHAASQRTFQTFEVWGFPSQSSDQRADEAWQTPHLARHTELTHHIAGADQMNKHALDLGLKRIQSIGRLYRPIDTPMRFQS